MKPALAFRQPHFPQSWRSLPKGELILSEINQLLSPWWPKFFGYHLLKIGALSGAVDSEQCTIRNQLTVFPSHNEKVASLKEVDTSYSRASYALGDVDDLPIAEHSIDVCLLSHALEFSLDPHHVVREASRVLIPNGYLVITGYNPLSLVSLNKILPYRRHSSPWNEHFFTPMRVKDWLHLMGFEILSDQRCLHSTLISNGCNNNGKGGYLSSHWKNSWNNSWNNFANKFLPKLGSVYVIVAKKRVLPLTPIKPKWKLSPRFESVKVPSMNSSRKSN